MICDLPENQRSCSIFKRRHLAHVGSNFVVWRVLISPNVCFFPLLLLALFVCSVYCFRFNIDVATGLKE